MKFRMSLSGALGLTLLPLLGGCAALTENSTRLQNNMASVPPTGRMISVDGRQVHLYCTGTGAPTVILETGKGGGSVHWAWIQRDVAKVSRVCSYDRPGYGWSDPTEAPMDAVNTSRQLYALLKAANEKEPYVAVGQSIGGDYARMFATEHRQEVAGLVLVDASSPSVLTTYAEVGLPPFEKSAMASVLASSGSVLQVGKNLGLVRTTYSETWNKLPPDVRPTMEAFVANPQLIPTSVKESQSLGDSLMQVRALDSLGDMPVTVIASDKWIDPDPDLAAKRAEWNKRQQRNWLAISTNSRFLIVPGADHMSLLSTKEHAAAVADSIVKMVKTVKEHMRSPGRTTRHQSPRQSSVGPCLTAQRWCGPSRS